MTVTGAIGAVCMFPLRAIINISVALGIHPNVLTLIGVFLCFCLAELAAAFPDRAGGLPSYAFETFKPWGDGASEHIGGLSSWAYWLGWFTVAPINAYLAAQKAGATPPVVPPAPAPAAAAPASPAPGGGGCLAGGVSRWPRAAGRDRERAAHRPNADRRSKRRRGCVALLLRCRLGGGPWRPI